MPIQLKGPSACLQLAMELSTWTLLFLTTASVCTASEVTRETLPTVLSGTTNLILSGSYSLDAPLIVQAPATLTIRAGTWIYASGSWTEPPAIVIMQGAILLAEGNASSPITMTTALEGAALQDTSTVNTDDESPTGTITVGPRGKWGGLFILGRAPTNSGPSNFKCVSVSSGWSNAQGQRRRRGASGGGQ